MENVNYKFRKNNRFIVAGVFAVVCCALMVVPIFFLFASDLPATGEPPDTIDYGAAPPDSDLGPVFDSFSLIVTIPFLLLVFVGIYFLTMHRRTYVTIQSGEMRINAFTAWADRRIPVRDILLGMAIGGKLRLQRASGNNEAEIYLDLLSIQDIEALLARLAAENIEVKSI